MLCHGRERVIIEPTVAFASIFCGVSMHSREDSLNSRTVYIYTGRKVERTFVVSTSHSVVLDLIPT